MAYLGQQPVVGRYILVDDISSGFDGSDTTFNLQASSSAVIPGLAQNLLLSLGGIIQKPGTDYTVNGSVLTFTTAPEAGTTFFATILGDAYAVGTPSDGTVQPASLANTGNFAFPDEIRWLEDSGNGSNYVGFKAAASISSNKIWTLPSADGSAGQHLATDGNGVLSWATDQTGTAGTTLSGSTNNTICTVTGANAIVGEADLTWDGDDLIVNKTSGDSDVIIKTTTSGNPVLKLNASGAGGHDISHDRSSNSLIFTRTGSAERMRINSSGYLGVGENNPATILHVKANLGDMLRLDRDNAGAVGNQIAFRHKDASNALIETGSINCISTANAATGSLAFYTKASGGSNAEKLRIDSSGKVGIGTTSPGTLLDCEIAASDKLEYGGNPRLFLQCATGNNGLRIYSDTSPLEVRADNTSRYFFVNGSPTFDTTWAGKTCTSGSTFDSSPKIFLNGTRWNGSASVTSFQTSIQAVATSATNNDGYLGLGASATPDDLRIKTDGKVGINQTPAVSYLEISHTGTNSPVNQIELNTPNVSDGGGSGIFFKNSGATGSTYTNRYGSRIHTIRENNGASVFVISNEKQGGTTGLIEAVRIDTNQNVKVSNGNLVIGTSGKGIDFSATADAPENSPTTNSELFDDYEEGTWTPFLAGVSSAGSGTYADTWGSYTRIGRVVYASFRLYQSAHTGSGGMRLDGLPFTAVTSSGTATSTSNGNHTVGSIDGESISLSKNKISAQLENANTRFRIMQSDGDMAWVNIENGQLWLNGTIWYETN